MVESRDNREQAKRRKKHDARLAAAAAKPAEKTKALCKERVQGLGRHA